jgi:hypothetical protein
MREDETRWKELCARAQKEQDPEKLCTLVHEINALLSQKRHGVDAESKPDSPEKAPE